VRTYFIEVESMMIRYQTQLLAGIRQDAAQLARDRKTRRPGYVYVMKASGETATQILLKIGRTINIVRRMRDHNTARADDIELLFAIRTADPEAVEGCAKALLSGLRCRTDREVYAADLDEVKALIAKCDGLSSSLADHVASLAKHETGQGDNHVYLVSTRQPTAERQGQIVAV